MESKIGLVQDPDVMMVGEMRDSETAAIAVQAAMTGHLVFSTLHTNDAKQTLDRIVDTFPADAHQQLRSQMARAGSPGSRPPGASWRRVSASRSSTQL